MVRHEPDGWSTEGEKITADATLARIRAAADDGGIIVQHWFYRGARSPDLLAFDDFESFEEYVKHQADPGDAFDIWSFIAVCAQDRRLAWGKFPDEDGSVPARGAY
jgi:hypothetical protein